MFANPSKGRAQRAAALVMCPWITVAAHAAPPLEQVGTQSGPGGAYDLLDDGRVIGLSGATLLIETAPRSGQFTTAGVFDPGLISEFGASFLSVSPDSTRFVVGDGHFGGAHVYEVAVADLNGGSITHRSFEHENFAAAWYDHNRIAITAADPNTFLGEVSVLDLTDGSTTRIIRLDGASGGLAFDQSGNLYTANGFDFLPGGSVTGDVRAFLSTEISEVLSGGRGVIEFAADGQFIGRVLSGSGLHFDSNGHLFIGGGDFDRGEFDFFAVADGAAVQRALNGLGSLDGPDLFADDPDAEPFSFYNAIFNEITGEWLVASGSSSILYRYASIPAPSAFALGLGGIGLSLLRRQRRGVARHADA